MKKYIIILISAILIGGVGGFIVFHYTNQDENIQKTDEISILLNNINLINELFSKTTYSSTGTYTDSSGNTCQQYIGEDVEYYINLLESTYVVPFFEDGYFQLVENETKDVSQLYVCKPTCTIVKYDINDYNETKKNGQTFISIYGNEMELIKDDNYKFYFPLVNCQQ